VSFLFYYNAANDGKSMLVLVFRLHDGQSHSCLPSGSQAKEQKRHNWVSSGGEKGGGGGGGAHLLVDELQELGGLGARCCAEVEHRVVWPHLQDGSWNHADKLLHAHHSQNNLSEQPLQFVVDTNIRWITQSTRGLGGWPTWRVMTPLWVLWTSHSRSCWSCSTLERRSAVRSTCSCQPSTHGRRSDAGTSLP